jgi:hypothetical protein
VTLTARGGVTPYKWSHTGTLPKGLHLSSAGVLSGTPTTRVTKTYNFTIKVTDSTKPKKETATKAFSVTITG